MNRDDVVGAVWYGARLFKLVHASGVERQVKRVEWEQHFARLYPGKRLPWAGEKPTHAELGS